MSSEPISLNETGVTRTMFAIRTLLIGLEFEASENADLLSGMAAVLGLHTIRPLRADPNGPTIYRIVTDDARPGGAG